MNCAFIAAATITIKNKKLFKTVRTCFDTIEWVNEADHDPEILYEKQYKDLLMINETDDFFICFYYQLLFRR